MKDIFKLGGLLLLITIVAASALAAVYNVTKPLIEEQKRIVLEKALLAALPEADAEAIVPVIKENNVLYYKGYKSKDKTLPAGCAFVAYGPGYSSTIETMVGVDSLGNIIGLKIMSQTETPGLGTKVEEIKYGQSEPWFQKQFLLKSVPKLAVDKDGGDIQSVTGATISSRAVTKSIVQAYEKLQKDQSTN